MGLADAFISIIAKKVQENLDAKISSRLSSDDLRLNNLNASISSRLASSDSRLDKLDIAVSSRLGASDTRLDNLDIPISSRLSATDPRIIGWGMPKLPIKAGYTAKDLASLAGLIFFLKNYTLSDGDLGLKYFKQGDATANWVTLINLTSPGYLFGLMVTAAASVVCSLRVFANEMMIVDIDNQSLVSSHAYLIIGRINGYRTGITEYTVVEPNFELPMLYNTLQIQIKCSNSNIVAHAVYMPLT